jgi:hypothetical protein
MYLAGMTGILRLCLLREVRQKLLPHYEENCGVYRSSTFFLGLEWCMFSTPFKKRRKQRPKAVLIWRGKVALVAGEGFGSSEHVRISYATSMKNLEQGLDQIETALKRLLPL